MTRVLLATPQTDVRAALRLLLLDLSMEIAGEAADWATAMALAPVTQADMLLIDWELISANSTNTLSELRAACRATVVIVLISQLDARGQAALSAGADVFISQGEMPDRVSARLQTIAAEIRHR